MAICIENIKNTLIYKMNLNDDFDRSNFKTIYNTLIKVNKTQSEILLLINVLDIAALDNLRRFNKSIRKNPTDIIKISKIAILTNEKWIVDLSSSSSIVTKNVLTQLFDLNQEKKAIDWLQL